MQRFDELLSSASPDELKAVEQIVLADPRLAFDTNLSRRLESAPGPLSEPRDESYRRHSLAWMMALARVEVGAMVAAYTPTPKPFTFVKPTVYEQEPYRELLQDALRTHFISLPAAWQWRQMTQADSRLLLVMHRRLSLAIRLAEGVLDSGIEPAKAPLVSQMGIRLQSALGLVEAEIRERTKTLNISDPDDQRRQGTKEYEIFRKATPSDDP